MKKRIVSFLVCAFFAVFAATSVYAHAGDVFKGKYTTDIQKNMVIRVTQSAQTSFFNSYVYNGALDWNNISSNVHVSVVMEVPGMPSIADSVNVYDDKGEFDPYYMGRAYYYNKNGVEVENDSNSIAYSIIRMNIDSIAYDELPASQRSDGARMCFIHEVGHTLMLAHPYEGSAFGHYYANLLPYAVMNTGLPVTRADGKYDQVAWTVTDHDKSCLRGKWGN